MTTTKILRFSGRVGGVTYDDPGLFERAAHALGHFGVGRRSARWKVGTEVALTIDEVRITGQVWDRGPRKETYWIALEDGRYALLGARHRTVLKVTDAAGVTLNAQQARIAS